MAHKWLGWQDSNLRMPESKSGALPTWLHPIIYYLFQMGWIIGVEPMTSRATIWRSNQLSYTHHIMARLKRFELLAHCLEGSCSIQLSYRRILERVMGIEPTQSAWKAEILPLNYTRILNGFFD
ncbi:MAG: hypothetical protein PWP27_1141 [Clostridiales bacterium]|nr:hypothetical protein [Clostridiales bacterium]MDK2933331.1 hypothetical protein [Clostridiales bacterium]